MASAIAVMSAAALGVMAQYRLEGFSTCLSDYASAYLPAEIPTLKGFSRTGRALTLELGNDVKGTWAASEGTTGLARPKPSSAEIVIPTAAGIHSIGLAEPGRGASASFTTISGEGSLTRFSSSSLLVGEFDQRPVRELIARIEDYPALDVQRVRALLTGAGLRPSSSTIERTATVWRFLEAALANARGEPMPHFERRPAFEQYELARQGKAKLHCANFAEIFALFATVAGIPTRIVDALRNVDGVDIAGHAFNEVYLPEERRFAYVDVNLNIFTVRAGSDGPLLNAVQIVEFLESGAAATLVASAGTAAELKDVPYDQLPPTARLLLTSNATFVYHETYKDRYSAWSLLKRYIFAPEPAFSLHSPNTPHVVKLIAFYGMVSALLALLGVAIHARLAAARPWASARLAQAPRRSVDHGDVMLPPVPVLVPVRAPGFALRVARAGRSSRSRSGRLRFTPRRSRPERSAGSEGQRRSRQRSNPPRPPFR